MESDWKHCTIGDAITLQRGFDITRKTQVAGSVPVVSSGGIKSFHAEAKVNAPGVVLGRKGTLGTVFFLDRDFWPHDTTLWVKDFKGNHERFVYYFFRNMSHDLQSLDVGTSNPALNRNHVHPIPTKFPALPEQRAIAHILGSLDDRIELNRRMNATLEGMVQALFKSWFVDFDPVIDNALVAGNTLPEELTARAELRRIALDEGTANRKTASQFPDTFVETEELGWIPRGWDSLPFKEITSPKSDRARDARVPEYSSTNDGLSLRADRYNKQLAKTTSNNKLIHYGDLIFGMSRKVLNFGLMHQEIGSVSSAYHVYTVDQSRIFPEFVETYIRSKPGYYYGMLSSSSREGQSLSKLSFNSSHMLIPKPEIQNEFQHHRDDLSSKRTSNDLQNHALTKLRDTLLPKLISGELRIPDAEKLAEAALA